MRKNVTSECLYLYADGHAVITYSKPDADAGRVQWAEVHEAFGPACKFNGRLVISRPESRFAKLMKSCIEVHAKPGSTENGSDNTKKHGIAVAYLKLVFSHQFDDCLTYSYMPDLLNIGITQQPETVEAFDPNTSFWAGMRVAKIYRKPAPVAQAA
jgi:hypothetical protein